MKYIKYDELALNNTIEYHGDMGPIELYEDGWLCLSYEEEQLYDAGLLVWSILHNKLVLPENKYSDEELADAIKTIRAMRSEQCFNVINRSLFWYERLTTEQRELLHEWYLDWLDAPNNLVVPTVPKEIEDIIK